MAFETTSNTDSPEINSKAQRPRICPPLNKGLLHQKAIAPQVQGTDVKSSKEDRDGRLAIPYILLTRGKASQLVKEFVIPWKKCSHRHATPSQMIREVTCPLLAQKLLSGSNSDVTSAVKQ
ncbi:hypothetical protein Y1Q_0016166 [Alligator mississippiensis]|uniref:Uncharacterized protein n=1 Tax=Alligator mississippiensis TaxID=8496 RepID=A0A151P0Z3_ALLMI|nr:hypothetical protein Y1Q_0016166 [Alligator mississippiensis]